MIPLMQSTLGTYIETEGRMEATMDCRRKDGELLYIEYGVSVPQNEKVLEMSGGNGCSTL